MEYVHPKVEEFFKQHPGMGLDEALVFLDTEIIKKLDSKTMEGNKLDRKE